MAGAPLSPLPSSPALAGQMPSPSPPAPILPAAISQADATTRCVEGLTYASSFGAHAKRGEATIASSDHSS